MTEEGAGEGIGYVLVSRIRGRWFWRAKRATARDYCMQYMEVSADGDDEGLAASTAKNGEAMATTVISCGIIEKDGWEKRVFSKI